MAQKIFVLGGVGSGKTTAIRAIQTTAQRCGIPSGIVEPDFILHREYYADKNKPANERRTKTFFIDGNEEFTVTDTSLYDTIRDQLGLEVERRAQQEEGLLLIEFPQVDYATSFRMLHQLYPNILKGAQVLFIATDLGKRYERVHKRNHERPGQYLTDEVIGRFTFDTESYLLSDEFSQAVGDGVSLKIIENNGDQNKFLSEVTAYTEQVLLDPIEREGRIPSEYNTQTLRERYL